MAPEVGPAFQRLSREPLTAILSGRLAETVSRHVGSKEMRALWHFGREITYKIIIFASFADFIFCSKQFQVTPLPPRLVSHYGPPRARAPGPQMIWMASGSSLAFHFSQNDFSLTPVLAYRLAGTRFCCRLRESFVTESRSATCDVGGGGAGIFGLFRGRIPGRKSTPLAARPPPRGARGPGARTVTPGRGVLGEQDSGAGVARAWRGRGAGCRQFLA
eukprot:gene9430-biopygen19729